MRQLQLLNKHHHFFSISCGEKHNIQILSHYKCPSETPPDIVYAFWRWKKMKAITLRGERTKRVRLLLASAEPRLWSCKLSLLPWCSVRPRIAWTVCRLVNQPVAASWVSLLQTLACLFSPAPSLTLVRSGAPAAKKQALTSESVYK